jgi:alpha-L-fucosidase
MRGILWLVVLGSTAGHLMAAKPGSGPSEPATRTEAPGLEMDRRTRELQALRWGMFVCWSFSTFSGREWTPGVNDTAFFKATQVDVDQWAAAARSAEMGYILFLAKHHDGFCLWDTGTTERKVTRAPLGRDVLAELRKAADRHGVRLALYFSEGDWTWPGAVDGQSRKGGSNPQMKKAQLRELLTRYGPIEFIWFDHAVGDGGLSHAETAAFVKSLQPGCFVGFNNGDPDGADIRLGELGRPGPLSDATAAGPYQKRQQAGYRLAEFTYPILPPHEGGAMWFYSLPRHDALCHPAEKIYADYLGAVRHGNIFSLDVGPDYQGRLRDIDVQTLARVGRMIREKAPMPDLGAMLAEEVREEFLKWRFGLFLHFNLATFVNREWATGHEDPALFRPARLDCGQWAEAARAAGMRYGVLTVKHTEGYPLWDSGITTHDITAFRNYKGGRGDIVREFVNAFRSRGLKVGFYYCFPGDFSRGALAPGQPDLHGLPPEAAGDYAGFIKRQMSELLTDYGPIDLLWCDQYSNPYTVARWAEIRAHVKSLQPRCLVLGNNARSLAESDVYSYEYPWKPLLPPEGNTVPSEVCDFIGGGWFWHPGVAPEQLKSPGDIVSRLKLCNSRRSNYLLNVPPDRDGLIPEICVERLKQVGRLLETR